MFGEKFCQICSDPSTGINFGVLTCGSCKSFFRRSQPTHLTFLCPYDGRCVIVRESRKHCKRCRYDRCVNAGMTMRKPSAIVPQIKIEIDEFSPRKDSVDIYHGSNGMDWNHSPTSQTSSCMCQCGCNSDSNSSSESCARHANSEVSFKRLVSRVDEMWRIEQCLRFPQLPQWYTPNENGRVWVVDPSQMIPGLETTLGIIVTLSQHSSFFANDLTSHDRVKLLRNNALTMLVLNARFDGECFLPFASQGSHFAVPATIYDAIQQKNQLNEANRCFQRTFDPQMQNDWTLMLLLLMITLFQTNDMQFDDAHGIQKEAQFYEQALYRHILSYYDGTCRSSFIYSTLMNKIDQARVVQRKYHTAFAHVPYEARPQFKMLEMVLDKNL